MRAHLGFLLGLALLLHTEVAQAQGNDPAAAQALFDEAKRLLAQGNLKEACPKFLASLKLDPAPGAALNLATCYEKNGQTASAWARYIEAASLARQAGQLDREKYAGEQAALLEPRLLRLVIRVASAPNGLSVMRDGLPVDAAVRGAAVPVDPGKHVVEARAPGKKPWSITGGSRARGRQRHQAGRRTPARRCGGADVGAAGSARGIGRAEAPPWGGGTAWSRAGRPGVVDTEGPRRDSYRRGRGGRCCRRGPRRGSPRQVQRFSPRHARRARSVTQTLPRR